MAVVNHGPPQKRGAIVPREKKVGRGGEREISNLDPFRRKVFGDLPHDVSPLF